MISMQKLRGAGGRSSPGSRKLILAGLILAVGLLALAPGAWGQTVTWTNAVGSFDYNHWLDWDTLSVPAAGDTASFTNTQFGTIYYRETVAGPYDFSFSNTGTNAYNIEVYNGATLNLGNLTVNNSGSAGAVTIFGSGTLNLAAGVHTFNIGVQPNLNTTLSLSITGAGSIDKTGAGALVLSGNNSYSGGTTLDAGSLNVGHTNALGSGGLTINGGNFQAKESTVVSVGNAITVGGNFAIGGNSALTMSGTVDLGGVTRTLTINNTANTTLSGIISNGGLSISNAGGASLILSGNNTYAGGTTLTAGTLLVGHNNALGTGGLIINAGTLGSNAAGITLANAITVGASFNLGSTDGNDLTLSQDLALGGFNINHTGAGTDTLAGTVSGAGSAIAVNAGTLILSGANTYDGGTTLTAGTLAAGHNNALGTGGLTINGGTLQAATGTTVSLGNAITMGGAFAIGGAAGDNLTLTSDIANGGSLLTVSSGGNTTLSGNISGAGGITQSGAGTLTLSGVNLYTGATTITAGTLALDATGTIADSSGVANAGTFTIAADKTIQRLTGAGATTLGASTLTIGADQNLSGTYTGVASGTGGITTGGTGTLTLGGANLYTGATTIGAGSTLALDATGTIADSSGVANAGTFTIAADKTIKSLTGAGGTTLDTHTLTISNGSGTYTGNASGTGGITVTGGTLTLGGENAYTGATTITAGTLALDATGTIADSSGVVNAGTFTIAAAKTIDSLTGAGATTLGAILTIGDGSGTDCTYSGAASGTGGITKASTGTLTLSGINTFSGLTTVSAGTLSLTGSITGGGGVTVDSPGTFNLTAGGSLIGNINNSGTVALNGAQTGAFTNNADATLTGTGTISGALVNNGTVNPGNSPGTLTVGSYTVNPGATHVVEIASASSYDKLVSTGAVTLNGGTLSPQLLGGFLPTANQIFTNIITGSSVTGTFTLVEDSQTLGWRAIYNATSVDLQAYQDFGGVPGSELSVTMSANQRSVANMLNALPPASGDLLEMLNAINALTTADAVRGAYNNISPQKYAALPTLGFPVTHMQFQYLLNRLARQRWEAKLGRDAVSSGGGGFMRGFNFGYDSTKMLLASNTFTLSDAGNPLIRLGQDHRWGIYLEPMANWGGLRPSANLVGYHYKNFGFTLGADYWITNNWLVGVNTGYSKTLTGIGGTGGDINANVIPFNAYTAFFLKGFYVNGTMGYTYSNYDMERNVTYGTINRTAKANTSGNQFQAAAETGYDFKIGKAIVGPTVTLQYATQTTGGFTENNAGALSLRVDSQTAYSLQTGVGARASYRAKVGNITVKPQVSVAWQHEFSQDTRGVNARLAQGSTTMNWRTDKIGQNFAVVSVDVPARISKNLVANIGYTAEVGRARSSNQGINLCLRYEF